MKYLFTIVWIVSGLFALAGGTETPPHKDSVALKFSQYINASDLSKHLHVLASDEFEGRETGEPGQKKAGAYISDHFKKLGFGPSKTGTYYQHFPLIKWMPDGVNLTSDTREFKLFEDFYYFYRDTSQYRIEAKSIAFRGYGIDTSSWKDYNSEDLSGKVVLVLAGEPYSKDGRSHITGSPEASDWFYQTNKKADAAQKRNAEALLVVVEDYGRSMGRLCQFLKRSSLSLASDLEGEKFPVFYISEKMADELLASKKRTVAKLRKKMEKKGQSLSEEIASAFQIDHQRKFENVVSENVLAFLEGTDLKDEILVITAHYDHIGRDGEDINNGADDDGSGTVAVLELAEAFMKASQAGFGPRRSILFMTVSGEEKGLLGSRYYSENPVYPLVNTIADLNIDMVGRVDPKHDSPDYIYLIGSDRLSTDLHKISESANETYIGLDLDYTYNREDDPERFYYRSDHYNFARHNIPVIFYFSGTHEDYHKPTDTADKINYDKIEVISRLVFFTAWELVNRDERIQVDVTE